MNEMKKAQRLGEARARMVKELLKMIDSWEETLEDIAEEAIFDINPPADLETTDDTDINAHYDKVQGLIGEAVRQFHVEALGPIYALVSQAPESGIELEFFSDRPHTANGDPDNWPKWFRVYEGNLDGGDTVMVDALGTGWF